MTEADAAGAASRWRRQKTPQPEMQLRADKDTEYRYVRKILGDAKAAGMVHVGFMTTGKE